MPIVTLIQSGDFATGSVINAALATDSVSTVKIQDGNVTTPKLADASVTTPKLADANVTTAKLADGNVTTAKLADDAVDVDKLGDVSGIAMSQNVSGALDVNYDDSTIGVNGTDQLYVKSDGITALELADDAVDTAAIQDGAVLNAKIADATIAGGKMVADTITTREIGADAVTASELDLTDDYAFEGAISIDAGGSLSWPTSPTNSSHLANKAYVDSLTAGLSWKQAARVASAGNIDLSSAPASIDGVVMSSGDRVLVWQQTDASENGIYVYDASGSAMVRAEDLNDGGEFPSAAVFVGEGDSYADRGFICTDDSIIIGTDDVTFVEFTGAYLTNAGDALVKSGNTINLVAGDGFQVGADQLDLRLAPNQGLDAAQGAGNNALGIVVDGSRAMGVDSNGLYTTLGQSGDASLAYDGADGGLVVVVDGSKALERTNSGLAVKVTGAMEFDGGSLDVADGSIDNARLGADAVDQSKIADDAIQPEHLHADTLALMKGFDAKMSGTATSGSADITFTPSGSFPMAMPGHMFYLNGRLMEAGASLDYTVADNGDGSYTITLAQSAVSGDRWVLIYDSSL